MKARLSKKQIDMVLRTGFPYPQGLKFESRIAHQIDVEYDGVPVSVVVYRTGSDPTGDKFAIGAAFLHPTAGAIERKTGDTNLTLEEARKNAEQLAANPETLGELFR